MFAEQKMKTSNLFLARFSWCLGKMLTGTILADCLGKTPGKNKEPVNIFLLRL